MATTYDLTFIDITPNETIYDPLAIQASTPRLVRIYNYGVEDAVDLGVYIKPSSNTGAIDKPADFPPETDYQDVLTWGEAVRIGDEVSGGIKLGLPQNDLTTVETYISRLEGNQLANKIPMADIPAGSYKDITITLEPPPGGSTRRLYVDLVVE